MLRVADTGTGIPAEHLPLIFDRFHKADPSRASRPDGAAAAGSGLGLSIVKAIVEAHGGTVTVTSARGAGSTFTVTLPAPRGHAQTARDEPRP